MCRFPLCLPNFCLYPLARPQNFALQVETASLLRIVQVKKLLESLHHMFQICFAGLWGLNVQDLACLIECDTGGGRTTDRLSGLLLIFRGRGGLLVCFGEGATEDTGAGHDDLGYDAVGLMSLVLDFARIR